ncbi:MAG: ATP-binding cassette domain-containing protein [Planctomycetota bacterium]|nr:ATP-binding cassette domain-containing protein [Planctomycetota bacterium]
MPLLTLTDVAKTYDEKRPLFTGVSLTVNSKDKIGLIGPNGAGKSTLLKMLAGIEVLDAGTRVAKKNLRIGYLEQEPHFPPDITIEDAVRTGLAGRDEVLAELEELYAEFADPELTEKRMGTLSRRQEKLQNKLDAMGGHDVEHRISAAIHGVGLTDSSAMCANLSGGESRRVALARLLVDSPDLLLLDEPTNHLDAFVIAWLEKQLSELKIPLILVTHDRFLLDRVVDRIVEVDRGKAHSYPGNYQTYLERRAERLDGEAKSEKTRLALLKRETAWMRAGVLARATKAKARIDRFHDINDADKLVGPAELEMEIPAGPRLGTKVVEMEGVGFAYGERTILKSLDFKMENGMRLGVVGPNGAGKTTLLRILLGQLAPKTGRVSIGETVVFGTIEQNREDLDPEATVVEEVAGKSDHVAVGERKVHVAGFLDSFLFPGNKKMVKVGSLSGGERGRVLLAKLLLQDCNVLILDEPTNDLDLMTLRALEEALCAFKGCVLLVSHDRWFLDRVATHVLHLDGQGGAFLHTGDVSSLMERWSPPTAASVSKKSVQSKPQELGKGGAIVSEAGVKLSFQERKELEELVVRIEVNEASMATLDAKLIDPVTYEKAPAVAADLQRQRSELASALEADLERWEGLAARENV